MYLVAITGILDGCCHGGCEHPGADFCIEALEEALQRFEAPEIFNTDLPVHL